MTESTELRGVKEFLARLFLLLSVALLTFDTVIQLPAVPTLAQAGWTTGGSMDGRETPIGIGLPDGHFTENLGQLQNEQVRFYFQSRDIQVGLTGRAVLLAVVGHVGETSVSPPRLGFDEGASIGDVVTARSTLFRISFPDSNAVEPEGREELSYRSHYFLGNDTSKWLTSVRKYEEVVYEDLYDGIDLVYMIRDGRLKYEFLVSPGVDPEQIEIAYEGIESLRLDSDGNIIASSTISRVMDLAPLSYQGEDEVECHFSIRGPSSFGFVCQGLDVSRAVVIDPLVFSTYLGGADSDIAYDIAADASGSVFVVGHTTSPDFPVTPGAFDSSFNGTYDGIVAKLNPDGGSLAWATFFGGSDVDWAINVAISSSADVYVSGFTRSSDFPVTIGTFDESYNGVQDVFVARFTGDGLLSWATYLGGTESDQVGAIAFDGSGNIVLGIMTESLDFPITAGAFDNSYDGLGDSCVAKLSPSGSVLLWATFLGGSASDYVTSITMDTEDSVYATGMTLSSDFPVTPGAFDKTYNGGASGGGDGYVAKLNSTGSVLDWATYIGGDDYDTANDGIFDGLGGFYVIGRTSSMNFPVTVGAFDVTLEGFADAFILKLDRTGSDLIWASFLGGNDDDQGDRIALDVAGNVCVDVLTYSADFPVTPGAFDTVFSGTTDGVFAILNPNGTDILYATFFGGSNDDVIHGMILDALGFVYLAGETRSADFPVTPGAFDNRTDRPELRGCPLIGRDGDRGGRLGDESSGGGYRPPVFERHGQKRLIFAFLDDEFGGTPRHSQVVGLNLG